MDIATSLPHVFAYSSPDFADHESYAHTSCFPIGETFPDYIQINEMKFITGMRYLNAWRIYPDDSLEIASWNGNGKLLGSSERNTGIQGLYSRVSRISIVPKEEMSEAGVLGRSAYSVTLSRSGDGHTTSTDMDLPPSDLVRIIEELKISAGELQAPDAGSYLWVQPVEKVSGVAMDLNEAGACTNRQMAQNAEAIIGTLLTSIDLAFEENANKMPAPGAAVALKAGSGWYLVGHIRASD